MSEILNKDYKDYLPPPVVPENIPPEVGWVVVCFPNNPPPVPLVPLLWNKLMISTLD
mgnify:CR=1 FL=1